MLGVFQSRQVTECFHIGEIHLRGLARRFPMFAKYGLLFRERIAADIKVISSGGRFKSVGAPSPQYRDSWQPIGCLSKFILS